MANTATINSMATSVRRRLNLLNLVTLPDAELKEYIRDALSAFHEMCVSRWRDYFVNMTRIQLVASQESYPLPDDFRACIAVFATGTAPAVPGGILRQQLERFNMNQFGVAASDTSFFLNCNPSMYRIMGRSIYFTPVPSATSGGVELWYAPQFIAPVTDDTVISHVICTGWELWCIFEACVSVAARMSLTEFFQLYQAMQQKAEQRIVAAMAIRDETAPVMVNQFDSLGGFRGRY